MIDEEESPLLRVLIVDQGRNTILLEALNESGPIRRTAGQRPFNSSMEPFAQGLAQRKVFGKFLFQPLKRGLYHKIACLQRNTDIPAFFVQRMIKEPIPLS